MKKKMTFYIEDNIEKKFIEWIYKYYELTGRKLTKTKVLHMLLQALFESPVDQTITETVEE